MAPTVEQLREQYARARVGQVVGKWQIEALLGIGGVAAVYSATHITNARRVAVKILHGEHASSTEVRERFLEEGYAANQVAHPGVVAVLDDGITEDGAPFLVMDLLQGETLEERVWRTREPLGAHETLIVADQILDILVAAHAMGIVHRDIKPENVFVTVTGGVRLLDFGIARLGNSRRGRQTLVGTMMGTPAFMPPEQARGRSEAISGRTDLWALGATMYWLLSQKFVREAETINEELLQAMTLSVPSLAAVASVPPSVVAIVDRALKFEPEERWQSAREMQRAVRDAMLDVGVPGTHSPSLSLLPASSSRSSNVTIRQSAPPTLPGSIHPFTRSAPPQPPPRRSWPWIGALAIGVSATVGWVLLSRPGQHSATVPTPQLAPPAAPRSSAAQPRTTPQSEPAPPAPTVKPLRGARTQGEPRPSTQANDEPLQGDRTQADTRQNEPGQSEVVAKSAREPAAESPPRARSSTIQARPGAPLAPKRQAAPEPALDRDPLSRRK